MRRIFCFFGLHLNYHVKWIDHPEGKLGYWHCQTCLKAFNGFIHEPNPPNHGGVSWWRIREVNKAEVRKFLKGINDGIN